MARGGGIAVGSGLHAIFPLRRVPESVQFGVVVILAGLASAVVSQAIPRLPELAVAWNLRLYGSQPADKSPLTPGEDGFLEPVGDIAAQANERLIEATTRLIHEATRFDGVKLPPETARQLLLLKLSLTMPAPNNAAERETLTRTATRLEAEYGKGKYCSPLHQGKCLPLDDLAFELADRLLEQFHIKVKTDGVDVSMLFASQEVTGTADLHVECGDPEPGP